MRTLLPNDLDVDTVVPQFTDNQYVTEAIFRKMVREGLDYTSPEISSLRRKYVRQEFIRALIYSSQLVINRNAFRNNEFLYEFFAPGSESLEDFSRLMRPGASGGAIVPFFLNETALTDDVPFSTRGSGDQACQALSDSLADEYQALRFSHDDDENTERVRSLGQSFLKFLVGLSVYQPADANRLASELFASKSELSHEQFERFQTSLRNLASYAFGRSDLNREQLYQDWFIADGEVAQGRFKPDADGDCLFELKKLVDLRYTSMLPDRLSRYTFVPQGMPSRAALADEQSLNKQISEHGFSQFLEDSSSALKEAQRIIMARAHEPMTIPAPGDLTLADVVEIRQWDDWTEFAQARRELINGITDTKTLLQQDFVGGFEKFTNSFHKFQKRLGHWIEGQNSAARDRARVVYGCIRFGLRVGPYALSLVAPKLGATLKAGIEFADNVLSDETKKAFQGVSLNILTDFLNVEKGQLDQELSLNLELMNGQLEPSRDWLIDTAEKARQYGNATLSHLGERANSAKE